MPKISKVDSAASSDHRDRVRASPDGRNPTSNHEEVKWENVKCPICFEHPHNAVLLICSSHEKGCRPYMCDTSRRHSNCFDQFCKLHSVIALKSRADHQVHDEFVGCGEKAPDHDQLVCPLCRGEIRGWIVKQDARRFMNSLVRDCALGSCDFSGRYSELRKHARLEHPSSRPSFSVDDDVDDDDDDPGRRSRSQEIYQLGQYSFENVEIELCLEGPVRDGFDIQVWPWDSSEIAADASIVDNTIQCSIEFVRAAEYDIEVQLNDQVITIQGSVVGYELTISWQ